MGLINKLKGNNIYIDTNIFIYILEDFPQYNSIIKEFIDALENKYFSCYSSELTLAEILVPAFKKRDFNIIFEYKKILNDSNFVTLIPTNQDIYIYSASNRANYNLKLPDAIHVWSAQFSNCDIFLTNDKKIRTPNHIEVIFFDDFI